MSQNFFSRIQEFGSFCQEDELLIAPHLIKRQFKKDSIVLEEGHICQSFYYVEKGSLRQYRNLDGFSEMTINLFLENDFVLDHSSFTGQNPSSNIIHTLEDCELIELTIESIHFLIGKSPKFFTLGKILEPTAKNKGTQLMSPEEKYLALMKTVPAYIQRFPLKYIASYLNMTPETLSRVRAKIKY
jgi:CRP-like cAMP-binding protein